MVQRALLEASVVIPVRNMASTLADQLAALANQNFGGAWEVVVVDNGSTDGTRSAVDAWLGSLPNLRIVDAPENVSSGHARNVGSRASRAALLLFCDGDDIVSPTWVASMVSTLETYEMATGPIDHASRNPPVVARTRADYATKRAPVGYGFLSYALTCNLGVRRETFEAIGGFRVEFRSGNDVDFSWRAQLAGARLGFNDDSVVHKVVPATLLGTWRQEVRYASYAPLLYRNFRHLGMRRSSVLRGAVHWFLLLAEMPVLLPSNRRYRWVMQTAHRYGRLVGSIRHRAVFL